MPNVTLTEPLVKAILKYENIETLQYTKFIARQYESQIIDKFRKTLRKVKILHTNQDLINELTKLPKLKKLNVNNREAKINLDLSKQRNIIIRGLKIHGNYQ